MHCAFASSALPSNADPLVLLVSCAALLRANDPSLAMLDWRKKDVHDGIAQQLARGLHGNTHLRSLDLGFNPDFSDTALAPGCGLPGCPKPGCAQSSLEAALPHSSVLRIGLVGTDVSGAKASALHAACRANGLRAVRANDPSLGESRNSRLGL